MTPEKTHSQNPCCLPSWEERQVWPQQPPPPVEGQPSFSTDMVFGCHSPIFFPTRIFSLFLFSILFVRVSQSLFTTSLQLEPSRPKRWPWTWLFISHGRPWKSLSLFFLCHLQAKESLSYIFSFASKSQKTISKLTVFSSLSLPPLKNKEGWRGRKRKDKKTYYANDRFWNSLGKYSPYSLFMGMLVKE